MINATRRITIAMTLAAAAACSGGDTSPDLGQLNLGQDAAVTLADPCPAWRWVGVKTNPDAPCPDPGNGCSVAPLFGNAPNLGPALRRFCLYTCLQDPIDVTALEALNRDGFRIDRDCMVVGAMAPGTELEAWTWEGMRDRFRVEAGRSSLPAPHADAMPVRLAFLDTSPTRAAADRPDQHPGNSPHGYTLVHLARELACGIEDDPAWCAADITTRLALPYVGYDPERMEPVHEDLVRGGYFGTIGWLATAVRDEVEAWSALAEPPRLILNLSVAFDTVHGGLEADAHDMPAPVQALLAALEDLSCRGGIAVVAAGNRRGGPGVGWGPWMPASWERRVAPGPEVCDQDYDVSSPFAPEHRPLVFAAGGLSRTRTRLGNVADGGWPPRVAYGDHAVVEGHRPVEPTATLTGSSVSAAVVASAAAVLWYYRPWLTPGEVMELVSNAGPVLENQADFCIDGTAATPCPHAGMAVKRVRVCDVLATHCPPGIDLCPPTRPFECMDRGVPLELPGVEGKVPVETEGITCATAEVEADELPCPHWKYKGVQSVAWTHPQPGSDPCPNCTKVEGLLYVQLDPGFVGELGNATLTQDGVSWSLPLPEKGVLVVFDLVALGLDPLKAVALSFSLDSKTSVFSPIYVAP